MEDQKPLFRCNACEIKYMDARELEDHILSMHVTHAPNIKQEQIKCGYGSAELKYSYSSREEASDKDDHEHKSFNNDFNANDVANISTQVLGIAYIDFSASHDDVKVNKFQCEFCDKKMTTKYALKNHIMGHKGEKPFECSECGTKFSVKAVYKYHTKHKHGKANMNLERQQCPICPETFKNLVLLRKHTEDKHGVLPFACDVCSKTFATKVRLQDHSRVHTNERRYQCPHCDKKFAAKPNLNSHMKTHTGDKTHQCTVCGKSFYNKYNLNQHELTHGNRQRHHKCFVCNKAFYTKLQIKAHMLEHTATTEKIKCESCDRIFLSPHALKLHIVKSHKSMIKAIRENEPNNISTKQHNCNEAAKNFFQQQHKYECTVCHESFMTKNVLKVHMLSHTVEKPHKCPQCPKRFTMERNLKSHIDYTHNEGQKKYQCSKCDKSFNFQCRLRKHMLQMH